jgi:hypothetical protein
VAGARHHEAFGARPLAHFLEDLRREQVARISPDEHHRPVDRVPVHTQVDVLVHHRLEAIAQARVVAEDPAPLPVLLRHVLGEVAPLRRGELAEGADRLHRRLERF